MQILAGVAWGHLIVKLILQPVYVWLTCRNVGVPLIDWVRSVALGAAIYLPLGLWRVPQMRDEARAVLARRRGA
jgi:hypothetical protein